MSSFKILFSIVLVHVHAELIIRPSQSSVTSDRHKSFIALCTDEADNQILRWRSPQHKDVPENEYDRYEMKKISNQTTVLWGWFAFRVTAERQTNGIRLRIRNVTIDDQGIIERKNIRII